MTNDAKLGMLVGVLGVIVAAVLFAKAPPPAPSPPQPTAAQPAADRPLTALTVSTAAPPPVAVAVPEARIEGGSPLASTPVARTRKEVAAQPTSRQSSEDEEP